MKKQLSLIEGFKLESRSDLIQYIAKDIVHFEEMKIISVGFRIRENMMIDIFGMDRRGCAVIIKAIWKESDEVVIDLIREIHFINNHLPLIQKTLSAPAINSVFPVRGLLISTSFSKKLIETREILSTIGIEFFIYRPISFNGERFLWIGKFPVREEGQDRDHLFEKGKEILKQELKITKEEMEEFKRFEKAGL